MVNDLKQMQLGQTIRIEQLEFSCRLNILGDATPGLKVVEIAADYVMLDDEEAGVVTRIPIHCIQSILTPNSAPQVAEPVVQAA